MTFARKIRRYCFGVSFLPVSPLGGMVLRMGRGVPDSRIARCIGSTLLRFLSGVTCGVTLPRCSSGATCRVTLPDSHQGCRGGATLPDSRRGRRGGATLPDPHQGTTRGFARFSWGGMREATGAPFTTVGIGMRCFPFSFLIAVPAVR